MTALAPRAAEPTDDFPLADAISAHALMRPWWRALAEDDDVAVRLLNHPGAVGDAGLGLAGRLRDGLGVTVGQCSAMAVSNTVSVLGDGAWAFFCKTGMRSAYGGPGPSRRSTTEQVAGIAERGWLIRVERAEDGSWRVWGWTPGQEIIEKVILPPRSWQAAPLAQ